MMSGIAVVTLNYNGAAFLPAMIRSVARQVEECGAVFLLFDNGSSDGSPGDAEREFGALPWFSLVRSRVNLGFAAGANEAVRSLDADIVVLANSDTVFPPGSLKSLLDGLGRHPRAAVAGPRLLWPDGTLQPSQRDFPFPCALVAEHIPLLRRRSSKHSDHATERRVDWLVGAVLAIRSGAFAEAGGFDTDYFFYHEETDLSYRLSRMGWETWFVPSSEVVHIEGGSAVALYGRDTFLRYIPAKIMFLRKHGHPGSLTAFRLLMSAIQVTRAATGTLRPALGRADARFTPGYCRRALLALWGRSPTPG